MGLAELVCSNSLGSLDPLNAPGILKEEMRRLNSLIIAAAEQARVPAGSALAVDRDQFSQHITRALEGHPNIRILHEEISGDPDGLPLHHCDRAVDLRQTLAGHPCGNAIPALVFLRRDLTDHRCGLHQHGRRLSRLSL